MKIQRLSFDLTFHGELSNYERSRISFMGAHVERLFFTNGFDNFIIPNCNFVHLPVHDKNIFKQLTLPTGKQYDKEATIDLYLSKVDFFEIESPDERLKIIFEIIYEGLCGFAKKFNLSLDVLEIIYSNVVKNHFFISGKEHINKKRRLKATLMEKCLYDQYVYSVNVGQANHINSFDICNLSPIYVPAENPGISIENYVRFPTVIGWINDNTFRITCGHKEYNFLLNEMRIEVIEHEELKSKYVNWQSVH